MTGRLSGLLTVLGVTLAAAGVTAGSTLLPTPDRSPATAAQRLPVPPSSPTLVCPGSETQLVPDGGQPVDPGGPVLFGALAGSTAGPSSARLKLLGGSSGASKTIALPSLSPSSADSTGPAASPPVIGHSLDLTRDSAGVGIGTLAATALGPAVFTATPAGSALTLAAVQSTVARSGDLRALTATACSTAAPDSWLVGGGTAAGERLRLLLANPAGSPAVVDVDVHGPNGRVNAPSGDGVVVPPGSELPIFIDALAPGLSRVAVHVTTRSGRVRATLYDSRLRGLAPAGADDVPVASAPAEQQVIPGVSLVDGFSRTARDPLAAGSSAVRIAVPGTEDAVARVRLLDSSGVVNLPSSAVVTVPAGQVVDVPIAGLPAGNYTAVVDADVPVVAGALVGRSGTAGTAPAAEFAWAGTARRLVGEGYAVLPAGTSSALSLAAAGGPGRLVLHEVHADGTLGDPVDLVLAAGTSITQQLSQQAVAVELGELTGGPITASIVSTVPDPRGLLISVLPITLSQPPIAPRTAVPDSRLG